MIAELKVIKTEQQYRLYRAQAVQLVPLDPKLGTRDGDRLELLAKLLDDYEKVRYPFDLPDPIAALRFRMEEQGLQQKDLAPLLGGKNRVSEVLSGKRPLTVAMIRALSQGLGIPAELLIGQAPRPSVAARQKPARYRVRKRG